VKKGGFLFGGYIPCYSQIGNHLSDREKARDHTPPRKYDEPSESYKSFNLLKIEEINYKDFDKPSESYGSFNLPKFGQINYKDFNEQAKVMEVVDCSKLSSEKRCPLICSKLSRSTTRSSTSRERSEYHF